MHEMCIRHQKRFLRKPVRIFACACGREFASKSKLVRHVKKLA